MEKRDFAGLELGPPDISIRNVEARTYIVVVLVLGEGGGWLGATRPSDTRDHPDRTMLRCLKAPKQRPPRHDPGLPGAPTFENANESSFICKRICMYYHARVFLAIISHSKRDTPSVHFCKSFQTT